MNLSAIKALTGAGKYCTVLNTPDGRQWITEGHAAWLVEDVKIESAATIASLFNLTEKQIDKAIITIKDTDSPIFCPERCEEEQMDELGMMYSEGTLYIGLNSSRGALWINADFLKPVRKDYRQYFLIWREDAEPIVTVYDDLTTCKAIVLPLSADGAESVRLDAAKLCAPVAQFEIKRAEAKTVDGGDDEGVQERAPEQIDIFDAEVAEFAEVDG